MNQIKCMDWIQRKINLIWFVILLLPPAMGGQERNYIAGEYIVEVDNSKRFETFAKGITSSRARGAQSNEFTCTQLMTTPFNMWLFKIQNSSLSDDENIEWLQHQAGVFMVRKNRHIFPRVTPNDTDFAKQWQYINDGNLGGSINADMDMDLAWDITTGGNTITGDTIVICVIDDGINASHEDFQGNIWVNHQEVPDNKVDDDKNGYIDDYRGWNVAMGNDKVYSGGTHGTPVAGILGARGNNGVGVSGVNWRVKVMPVNYGFASEANALASYGYAYVQRKLYNDSKGARGAFVVATNASWGINELNAEDAVLWCSIYDSLGSVGILNVGATANTDTDVDVKGDMPTSCGSEYLISVTNLNRSDIKETSAGYGKKSIDLGGYGHQVYTLTRTGYGAFGGTSGAAPHVTGVIGLLYAVPCGVFIKMAKSNPAGAALVAKDMILHGVKSIVSMENISTTGGKLNANRSIKNIMSLCSECSPPAGLVIQKNDLSFRILWQNNHGNGKVNLRFRQIGKTAWNELSGIENNQEIHGLNYCTEYEVQIGSDCGFLPSSYSYSKYFSTSGCCETPDVYSLESDRNSVGIKWKTDQEATFKVEYKSLLGKWLDTIINDNSFILKNVPDCTAYTFKVSAGCLRYGNISVFSPEINVSSYCGSCTGNVYCTIGRKDATQEWVESFTLNNIVNKSGTSVGGYRDFTGLNKMSLDVGKEYDFIINAGYAGSAFPDYFKIYMDFDQNGKWTSDELVFKSSTALTNEIKGKIKIPIKAINGFTKLRLIMSYEQFDGPCNDDKFEFGEVEDYCIKIINNLCINSTEIRVSSIEKNSAKFIFHKSLQTKDSLRINYKLKGTSDWKQASGKDSVKISGLVECSLYEYRFQLNCDTIFSDFSTINTFTTACKNSVSDREITFTIRPNPATDRLSIDIPDGIILSEVIIYDIAGKEILRKKSPTDLTIDLNEIESGVYFIHLNTSRGFQSRQKFIKI